MSMRELSAEALQLLYQRKYYMLKSRCNEVEELNERLLNRIRNVNKVLKRYKKDRSHLMNHLDKLKDNYQELLSRSKYEFCLPQTNEAQSTSDSSDESQAEVSQAFHEETNELLVNENAGRVEERDAYIIYCREQKSTMIQKYKAEVGKDPGRKELYQALYEEWGSLSATEKTKYYDMSGHKEYFEAEQEVETNDQAVENLLKDEEARQEVQRVFTQLSTHNTMPSLGTATATASNPPVANSKTSTSKGVDFHSSFINFLKND